MTVARLINISLIFSVSAFGQVQANRRNANTQVEPQGKVVTTITTLFDPHSLEDLVNKADLVIDGFVDSVALARFRVPNIPGTLETDVTLRINRTIRGVDQSNLGRIVVAEAGGKRGDLEVVTPQNTLMQVGERYVFFLVRDDRSNLPDVSHYSRYIVAGVWSGKFKVEAEKIHASAESSPGLKVHEGENLNDFVGRIQR
jgi:hypothetical protein